MADRRSAGAESLAVFKQTLDRLLDESGNDRDIQERVIGAMRVGASSVEDICAATALARPVVERAVEVLTAQGRITTSKPGKKVG